jgi:1-deoxy-D-xylulose-5-phosphate reductoisomerase
MRHAIQYALTYPERCPTELPPLNLAQLSSLHFEAPDLERFPCISLAYQALKTGGTLPAAMNAANEEAVQAFIDERVLFSDIPAVIQSVMDGHQTSEVRDLAGVLSADRNARTSARAAITGLNREMRHVA